MTAAERSWQEAGLTLAEVSRISGVQRATLNNWYRNKPELFGIVLLGCIVKSRGDANYDAKHANIMKRLRANHASIRGSQE
jgi:AcrR family transcriptional regulator